MYFKYSISSLQAVTEQVERKSVRTRTTQSRTTTTQFRRVELQNIVVPSGAPGKVTGWYFCNKYKVHSILVLYAFLIFNFMCFKHHS